MYKFLPYITAIIAIGGFLFSVWKYIELKKIEENRLNYENFNKVLSNLSGKMLDNGSVKIDIGFLIGNLYQLLNFEQYKNVSLPVLEYMKNVPIQTDENSAIHIHKALHEVANKLKKLR